MAKLSHSEIPACIISLPVFTLDFYELCSCVWALISSFQKFKAFFLIQGVIFFRTVELELTLLHIFRPVNCNRSRAWHANSLLCPDILWQLGKWIGKGKLISKLTSWANKYSLQLANTPAKTRNYVYMYWWNTANITSRILLLQYI